jgi:hypothetical protein
MYNHFAVRTRKQSKMKQARHEEGKAPIAVVGISVTRENIRGGRFDACCSEEKPDA